LLIRFMGVLHSNACPILRYAVIVGEALR